MSDTYLRSSSGLTVVNSAGKAFITTSYSSGIMSGDIKGAWLSDTSTASVTGTELITNGTFDSDISGWSAFNSTLALSNNQIEVTRTALWGFATQEITMEVGKTYVLRADARGNGVGDTTIGIKGGIGNVDYITPIASTPNTTMTPLSVSFVATQSTGYIHLQSPNATGAISYFDNVSLRLAEPDRSVNNTGLAVYGTLTKTPVETGANLVGYSGWSKSNYLLRPAGVIDLNSSSMTFMTWYKCSSINVEEALISTGDYNTISEVRALYISPSGIAGFSGWANDFNPGSRSVRDDTWHHLAFTLQYISGTSYVVSVYVDGVLTGVSERTLLTFSNTAIDIGGGTLPLDRFARGNLALSRISTSIVSANQMLKIYNDEKALFQPNSQCTLYGSSDAVTALAYDDTTELLSVGTSSGRSDFQGLRRINNTTTAVTTAISASNGLIAEQ